MRVGSCDGRTVLVRLSRNWRVCFLEVLFVVGLITICSSSHIPSRVQEIENKLKLENETEAEPLSTQVPDTTKNGPNSKSTYLSAKCDNQLMTVLGVFGIPFRGRIYAYDYADELDCGVTASNDPSPNITFHLPLGQCGIQMLTLSDNLESQLRHEVTLYVQYSSVLQQVIDEKVTVFCVESNQSNNDIKLQDNPLGSEEDAEEKPSSRQGRRLKHLARNLGLPKSTTKIGEALMEIISGKDPAPKSKLTHPVAVGDDVTLIISTKVLRGYDARVVNCTTHDGSRHTSTDGSRVQPILDSAGCSVDRALVPNFRRRRLPVESRNRLITLHFTSFPAFKFPERDHLHIKCSVVYCQGPCPQESCDSGTNHYGTWREKYGRIADALVETAFVVNAIEVLSPELDSHGGHHYDRHQSNSPVGTVTAAASAAVPLSGDSGPFSDRQQAGPPNVYPTPTNPNANLYTNRASSLSSSSNPNYNGGGNSLNGPSSIYGNNNQNPQVTGSSMTDSGKAQNSSNNNVCISPGTVILALVILGVVLVISVTVTLWFALKRSEARKYGRKESITFNNPGPAPYYRFNHWQ